MRVATIGQNQFQTALVSDLNTKLQQLEFQITSGLKSQSYSGLSADGRRLLDFETSTAKFTNYIESIDQAERRLDVTQNALAQIEEATAEARAEYFAIQPYYEIDSTVRATATVKFESALSEVSRVLNTVFEGRFLFGNETTDTSGTVTNGPLVVDFDDMITTIDGLVAAPFTQAALEGQISTYVAVNATTDVATTTAGQFYRATTYDNTFNTSARIDDNQTVTYGVDANDQAIKRILKGVLMMHYATDRYNDATTGFTTTAEATNTFNDGFQTLEAGLEDLRVLVGQTGVKQQTLSQVRIEHETTLALLERQTAEVRDADAFEATTEFQRIQTQLQASYQVTAQINQLTLANFI